MSHYTQPEPSPLSWLDERFPFTAGLRKHFLHHFLPNTLNVWYFFGFLALVTFVLQGITGIFLLVHYQPDATWNVHHIAKAFASVDAIMRNVPWGWWIRYMHTTGASLLFGVLYMHIFRGFLYGSYRRPRELLWVIGMLLFLLIMMEAFAGSLLPWGQMSYWSTQVVTNLFSVIPVIGPKVVLWLRGDYAVSAATLHRFFALHVVAIPVLLTWCIVIHLIALRHVGSSSPDGRTWSAEQLRQQGVPFHPYYTLRDFFALSLFFIVYFSILCFCPDMGGLFLERANCIQALPTVTPAQMIPMWYFRPFYAMLRAVTPHFVVGFGGLLTAIMGYHFVHSHGVQRRVMWAVGWVLLGIGFVTLDSKFWGVVTLLSSICVPFFLPWLDRSPVRSIRHRPLWQKFLYALLAGSFITLGILGSQESSVMVIWISQILTACYLCFFLWMPWWSRQGHFVAVPLE